MAGFPMVHLGLLASSENGPITACASGLHVKLYIHHTIDVTQQGSTFFCACIFTC